jgi:hypothetical protein
MPRRAPLDADEPEEGEGLRRWRPRCPPTPTPFTAALPIVDKAGTLPQRTDLPTQVGDVQLSAIPGVILATVNARHDGTAHPLRAEWVIAHGTVHLFAERSHTPITPIASMRWANRLTDIAVDENCTLPAEFVMTVLSDLEIAFLRGRTDADLLAAADVTSVAPTAATTPSGTRPVVAGTGGTVEEPNLLADLHAAVGRCPWVRGVRRGTSADVRHGFDYIVTTADAGPLYVKVAAAMSDADEYRRTHHRLAAFQRTVLVVLSVERAEDARVARVGAELRRLYRRFGGGMMLDVPATPVPSTVAVGGGAPDAATTTEPVRLLVFADAPDCLLIEAPPGATVTLPALRAPFDMATVRDACHAAGSVVRVAEGTTTGQWTAAMARLRNDAKTERRQRAALEMDAHIAQLRKKGDAESVRRADLHEEKIAVDERLRACKNALTEAKTAAVTRGVYMEATKFRALERDLEEAKHRSQEIQATLAKLNAARYEVNAASSKEASLRFCERFLRVAKVFLDREDYEDIVDAARDESDDDAGDAVDVGGEAAS